MEEKYRRLWLSQTTDDFFKIFGESSTPLTKMPGASLVVRDGALALADMDEGGFLVADGQRHTYGNPPDARNTIYIVGASYAYSCFCRDEETIASRLQELCSAHLPHKKYAVKNAAIRGGTLDLFTVKIKSLPLNEGDIVILLSSVFSDSYEESWQSIKMQQDICAQKKAHYCFFLYPRWDEMVNPSERERKILNSTYKELYENTEKTTENSVQPQKYFPPRILMKLAALGCPNYDLQHWIERPHDMGEFLVDKDHVEAKGHLLFAYVIFKLYISQIETENLDHDAVLKKSYNSLKDTLKKYYRDDEAFKRLANPRHKNDLSPNEAIGSIVMNCNPFTLGHLHLIEETLKQVAFLYIFVVQENVSEFSFKARIKLITAGTAHLKDRIAIIPSGKFIISSFSFPEYFEKKAIKNSKIDTSHDVMLFGSIIAPHFGITARFIGEEPFCAVTKQYNESLKEILSKLGISVVELPRAMSDGEVISASLVRKYVDAGKMDAVKKFVPKTTYDFLIKQYTNGKISVTP